MRRLLTIVALGLAVFGATVTTTTTADAHASELEALLGLLAGLHPRRRLLGHPRWLPRLPHELLERPLRGQVPA